MKQLISSSVISRSIVAAVMVALGSCQSEDTEVVRTSLNVFSMMIDQELWQPFQDETDPCRSTYMGTFGEYGDEPMYTMYAYHDLQGIENAESETFLRVRIMNVNDTGTYPLDGSYHNDFDSYFIFVSNQSDERRRYVNDPQKEPFYFYVEEFIPIEGMFSRGVGGTFEGVLYNEQNPADSLIITQGQFKFGVVNHSDHCGL